MNTRADAELRSPDPRLGYVAGSFYIECVEPGRRPFIAAGNLSHHDGRYWLAKYRALHPTCTFALYQEGGRATTRLGGTTDADIQDRERDNIANTGDC